MAKLFISRLSLLLSPTPSLPHSSHLPLSLGTAPQQAEPHPSTPTCRGCNAELGCRQHPRVWNRLGTWCWASWPWKSLALRAHVSHWACPSQMYSLWGGGGRPKHGPNSKPRSLFHWWVGRVVVLWRGSSQTLQGGAGDLAPERGKLLGNLGSAWWTIASCPRS